MNKPISTLALLVLAILLAACAASPVSGPIAKDLPIQQAQPQAAATAAEKVVTLVPESEKTSEPQPAVPVLQAMDEKGREKAIANLRSLLGNPELEVTYNSLGHSPNATNHPAALFVDSQGNTYYVSQVSLQPIEFTLEQPIKVSQAKSADELRAIAHQLAKDHSTRFANWSDKLVYSEGNKGGENSFFSWKADGTDVGGMPATFQVGLKQDGTLFSYLNSLDFLP